MRDPRRDPQAGDVLQQSVGRGEGKAPDHHTVEVLGCDGVEVHLRRSEGRGAYGREAWTTLDGWRGSMASAEVVR